MLDERLQNFKQENLGNRTVECLLPEEISRLVEQEKIKMRLYPTDENWIGITNPGDEILVKEFLDKK